MTSEADVIVIGSGAGGATAAFALARAGVKVQVLEEGTWHRRPDFGRDLYGAMRTLFRDFGAQAARGASLIPLMEGRCVGGSTVMNGAIVHRLPASVHAEWCRRDPGLAVRLPFEELETCATDLERELRIGPTLGDVSGLPACAAASRLGWAAKPMSRNAPGCEGSGRCLQGCPSGGKWSMEASFLPRAQAVGAEICSGFRVESVRFDGRRAVGVVVRESGRRRLFGARKAVVVAAGSLRSPLLLKASGVAHPHLGRHFQCHLGAGVVGLLPGLARDAQGPPQGLEILPEGNGDRIKLATQLLPPELLLARTGLSGEGLRKALASASRWSAWTASVRAEAEGEVVSRWGRPAVSFSPTRRDLEAVREGVYRLARLLFEMGALEVHPGVAGLPGRLGPADADQLRAAPLDPRAYGLAVGHMFGTCRLGSEASLFPVDPDGAVRGHEGLYVMDASVLPTNLGVNPQHAIMTLSLRAASRLAQSG